MSRTGVAAVSSVSGAAVSLTAIVPLVETSTIRRTPVVPAIPASRRVASTWIRWSSPGRRPPRGTPFRRGGTRDPRRRARAAAARRVREDRRGRLRSPAPREPAAARGRARGLASPRMRADPAGGRRGKPVAPVTQHHAGAGVPSGVASGVPSGILAVGHRSSGRRPRLAGGRGADRVPGRSAPRVVAGVVPGLASPGRRKSRRHRSRRRPSRPRGPPALPGPDARRCAAPAPPPDPPATALRPSPANAVKNS